MKKEKPAGVCVPCRGGNHKKCTTETGKDKFFGCTCLQSGHTNNETVRNG